MYKGLILLLLSSFTFALSTIFAKFVTTLSDIPGVEITFFRFLIGILAVFFYMIIKKVSLRPTNIKYVLLRSLSNIIAVMLFFTGIQFTTVSNANMLNSIFKQNTIFCHSGSKHIFRSIIIENCHRWHSYTDISDRCWRIMA